MTHRRRGAVADAMKLMLQGARARSMRETRLNHVSSGGHTVFSLRVERRTTMASGAAAVRCGALHVVDLAGSERVKVSAVTGTALTEAREINRSLSTLGRVISKARPPRAERAAVCTASLYA